MKNVLEYLVNTASRLPEKMAVTDGEEDCSYSELELKSYLVGRVLSDYVTPASNLSGYSICRWILLSVRSRFSR